MPRDNNSSTAVRPQYASARPARLPQSEIERCLREHLTNDTEAAGAEGEAKANFVLARLGPREQQARQVHARDQQQHGYRGQQQTQGQRVGPPKVVESLRTGQQRQRGPLVGGTGSNSLEEAERTAERRAESPHGLRRHRAGQSDEASVRPQTSAAACREAATAAPKRHRDVHGAARFEPEELARRDADHGERLPHQIERATDDLGISAEVAMPEVVADYRDERPAWAAVVGGLQQPAQQGDSPSTSKQLPDTSCPMASSAPPAVESLKPGQGRKAHSPARALLSPRRRNSSVVKEKPSRVPTR